MAREIFKYEPLDLQVDTAVGLSLPINLENGKFKQTYTTADQARTNLKNLLLTIKGERVFQPDFGTNLYNILFEPNTESLKENIKEEIKDSISKWVPYITISSIVVVGEDNTVRIKINYKVSPSNFGSSITLEFDLSTGISSELAQ
tara:strand:- start:52787 stop:53224 length:438 start_codon:yes stop_codon:yes gene_type:complete